VVVFGEAIWDPVVLIARIGNTPAIIFGALVVMLAQLTTNMAANVVSPANDFSSLSPRRISYVAGGLITAAIGIVMMPWKLYADAAAYIFTWLIGYSSLMGAIGGILIADYWVLRGRHLITAELFKLHGRYTYADGVNPRAMIALAIAILPVVPGFLHAEVTPGGRVANPSFLDVLYTYAWFVTFALGFAVYLALSWGQATPCIWRSVGVRPRLTTGSRGQATTDDKQQNLRRSRRRWCRVVATRWPLLATCRVSWPDPFFTRMASQLGSGHD
jgi:NCS1 family nucleobase:cation symporter-1